MQNIGPHSYIHIPSSGIGNSWTQREIFKNAKYNFKCKI